jgi:hypothetical protein
MQKCNSFRLQYDDGVETNRVVHPKFRPYHMMYLHKMRCRQAALTGCLYGVGTKLLATQPPQGFGPYFISEYALLPSLL